jgi:hypothetical protein
MRSLIDIDTDRRQSLGASTVRWIRAQFGNGTKQLTLSRKEAEVALAKGSSWRGRCLMIRRLTSPISRVWCLSHVRTSKSWDILQGATRYDLGGYGKRWHRNRLNYSPLFLQGKVYPDTLETKGIRDEVSFVCQQAPFFWQQDNAPPHKLSRTRWISQLAISD